MGGRFAVVQGKAWMIMETPVAASNSDCTFMKFGTDTQPFAFGMNVVPFASQKEPPATKRVYAMGHFTFLVEGMSSLLSVSLRVVVGELAFLVAFLAGSSP